jgi:adenylate kinase
MGVKIDVVLSIEVPDDKIIARMSGRRVCQCGASYHVEYIKPQVDGVCDKCGSQLYIRDDDREETVANRLKTYHAQTEPLKDFYAERGNLICVEGQEEVADTTALVLNALEAANA